MARAAAVGCGSDGRLEPYGGLLGDASSVILPSENHSSVEANGGWRGDASAVLEHGCLARFCSFLPALLACCIIAKALAANTSSSSFRSSGPSARRASRTSFRPAPSSGCCSRSLASSGLTPKEGLATRSPLTASRTAASSRGHTIFVSVCAPPGSELPYSVSVSKTVINLLTVKTY